MVLSEQRGTGSIPWQNGYFLYLHVGGSLRCNEAQAKEWECQQLLRVLPVMVFFLLLLFSGGKKSKRRGSHGKRTYRSLRHELCAVQQLPSLKA
jgi:hypothetical protein